MFTSRPNVAISPYLALAVAASPSPQRSQPNSPRRLQPPLARCHRRLQSHLRRADNATPSRRGDSPSAIVAARFLFFFKPTHTPSQATTSQKGKATAATPLLFIFKKSYAPDRRIKCWNNENATLSRLPLHPRRRRQARRRRPRVSSRPPPHRRSPQPCGNSLGCSPSSRFHLIVSLPLLSVVCLLWSLCSQSRRISLSSSSSPAERGPGPAMAAAEAGASSAPSTGGCLCTLLGFDFFYFVMSR
jgi:hypothetical protein